MKPMSTESTWPKSVLCLPMIVSLAFAFRIHRPQLGRSETGLDSGFGLSGDIKGNMGWVSA